MKLNGITCSPVRLSRAYHRLSSVVISLLLFLLPLSGSAARWNQAENAGNAPSSQ